jgi:hypothetical protein
MGENCGRRFFVNTLGKELPMKWRFGTTAPVRQYFKGGWSQFAEDHDLHQGFFMTFDFHIGTSKFDMRIYDGTQCQKEYEAEVHFHKFLFM